MKKIITIFASVIFITNVFAQEPITVKQLSVSPVIDGQIDEIWELTEEIKPDNYHDRVDPATGDLQAGDLELTLRMGWKDSLLYILMEQVDDVIVGKDAEDIKSGDHNRDALAYYFYLGEAVTATDTVFDRNDSVSFAVGTVPGNEPDSLSQIYFGTEAASPNGVRWNDKASISLVHGEYVELIDGDKILTEWSINLKYLADLSGSAWTFADGTKFFFDIERSENDLEFTNDASGLVDWERQSQTFLGPDAIGSKPFAKYNKPYSWHPMVVSDELLVVTALDEKTFFEDVSVYPNPSKGLINFQGNMKISSVKIYNVTGQLALSKQNFNSSSLDISELDKGVYLVELFDNKNQSVVRKLMVE